MNLLANTKPRSAIEIVDASFQVYRARFTDIFVVELCATFLPSLFAAVLPETYARLAELIGNFLIPVAHGVISVLVYTTLLGTPIGPREALGRLNGRIGTLILVQIATGLLVAFGLVAFLVPGVLAFVWTAVALPVVAIERESTGAAIGRSRHLVRGQFGHVFAAIALAYLATLLVIIGGGAAIGILAGLLGVGEVTSGLFLGIVTSLAFPWVAVATVMTYVDLRVRREALDIEAMIAPDASSMHA